MLQSTVLAVKVAELVVKCAGVYEGASVLILCDKDRWLEGEVLAAVCHSIGAYPIIMDLTPEVAWYYNNMKRPLPKPHLLGAMMKSNFCFAAADNEFCHMLGHTDENHVCQRNGMRWISVEEYMCEWNTSMKDIDAFIERTHKITKLLSECKEVRITTEKGTDMIFPRREGRNAISFVPKGGKKGEIVPNYGESAMVPLEWASNGRAVVDGIIVGLGEMRESPVVWDVKEGRIVNVSGGANAEKFKAFLERSGKNSNAIAECGICTSHIEKRAYEYMGRPGHRAYGAWGTMHIGIGHNTTIGGEIKSAIHVDCQIYDVTVEIDGVRVMDKGKYLF